MLQILKKNYLYMRCIWSEVEHGQKSSDVELSDHAEFSPDHAELTPRDFPPP